MESKNPVDQMTLQVNSYARMKTWLEIKSLTMNPRVYHYQGTQEEADTFKALLASTQMASVTNGMKPFLGLIMPNFDMIFAARKFPFLSFLAYMSRSRRIRNGLAEVKDPGFPHGSVDYILKGSSAIGSFIGVPEEEDDDEVPQHGGKKRRLTRT
ncbi:hypothetical protein Ciccas_012413 [Cichlidogyrus casuarinus]|uniref:Uncharacterized protein n=1 Tax=Cichlidogyrus casuarinus TaxID=1844966 RepID=A0ABD2PNJ9_9PLAT